MFNFADDYSRENLIWNQLNTKHDPLVTHSRLLWGSATGVWYKRRRFESKRSHQIQIHLWMSFVGRKSRRNFGRRRAWRRWQRQMRASNRRPASSDPSAYWRSTPRVRSGDRRFPGLRGSRGRKSIRKNSDSSLSDIFFSICFCCESRRDSFEIAVRDLGPTGR